MLSFKVMSGRRYIAWNDMLIGYEAGSAGADLALADRSSPASAAPALLDDMDVAQQKLAAWEAEAASAKRLAQYLARPGMDVARLHDAGDVIRLDQPLIYLHDDVAVWRLYGDGRVFNANEAARRMMSGADATGDFFSYFPKSTWGFLAHELARWAAGVGTEFELTVPDPVGDGVRRLAIAGAATGEFEAFGPPIIVTAADVTMRRRNEHLAGRLAEADPLTGLLNRLAFMRRLENELQAPAPGAGRVGLIYLDLDRFKQINDVHGHAVGDNILRTTGRRLRAAIRASDFAGRIGGDEFVVALPDIGGRDDALSIADAVRSELTTPLQIDGRDFQVGASLGVALGAPGHAEAERLLEQADLALYEAKRRGRNRHHLFDDELAAMIRDRERLSAGIRDALANGDLRMFYQPQFDLSTNSVTGYEALLRWRTGAGAILMPNEFLPAAEAAGLMSDLSDWSLQAACRDLACLGPDMNVSVNLSGKQFWDEGFAERLSDLLTASGATPERLTIEIGEAAVLQHPDRSAAAVDAIRETGVKLAVDNFGAAQSSLRMLQHVHVDVLKLDGAFARDLPEAPRARPILQALLDLGQDLDVKIIAARVEEERQADALREIACPEAQGFHFGKPQPLGKALSDDDDD